MTFFFENCWADDGPKSCGNAILVLYYFFFVLLFWEIIIVPISDLVIVIETVLSVTFCSSSLSYVDANDFSQLTIMASFYYFCLWYVSSKNMS